jgi:hypothetical protein
VAAGGNKRPAMLVPLQKKVAIDPLLSTGDLLGRVVQEDRNAEHRGAEVQGGYGRVLVYDLAKHTLRAVARVNTPPSLAPGEWESSGVINASGLLGKDTWLLDVQAHKTDREQPGPTLEPDSAVGEDGQLLSIRIPGS